MLIADALRKIPEALTAQSLARKYGQERKYILRKLQHTNPELAATSKLDKKSPFEIPAFLSSLAQLANKIGPKILEYHLLSDERSARIPTLVFMEWQKRVEQAYPEANRRDPNVPRVDFVLSGGRLLNTTQLRQFFEQNQERLRQQPQLLITDAIDEGSTLSKLFPLFDQFGITVDVAALSHYEPQSYYKRLVEGRTLYLGEILPSKFQEMSANMAVTHRNFLTGVDNPPDSAPSAHPVRSAAEKIHRPVEILMRHQAKSFARKLPIPKR